MNLILQILIAVVVAVLLAYVIVKYVPLKLRWIFSVLLLVASIFLIKKIYDGVMEPIKFDNEKVKRYSSVIETLKIIRDAEIKHKEVTGDYTNNKEGLIRFIDTAKLAITESRDTVIKVDRGGGIVVDVEKKKIDTIGYEPVLKYFDNRDYKNMFKVPGLNGKEFSLEASKIEKIPGLFVPVFISKVEKKLILDGLNPSLVKLELEAITTDEIKGEFVSVGSLDEVSTGGNWPPSYDKNDRKE